MATRVIETGHPGVHRIGRYDLVAEIASGGMATVYLARLSGAGGFQRNVAIKVLHPHLAYDREFVEMFLDEARLAAMIHHPNVVPIQEVGEGDHGYYLVMDYIEGDTFAALLSRSAAAGQPVPREVVVRVALDMLFGLHAAHELRDEHGRLIGVVHRDVSPQNVLVGTDGVTRLTDFGVARAASRLSATRAGQLKGKLAYMAPEQASGDEHVDRRADIFSAGIVLWEALALRRLFKASNEAATLSRVLTEPIRSPADFNPGVPTPVAHVCLRALMRDPRQRFGSSAEFADALEAAARHSGVVATNREVAAYVQHMVGADVEAHRAAIRQWLDKRDQLGVRSPSAPAPRSSQVPVLPLRSPPIEPSQTFSSWSIAGYPGRPGLNARVPRNANLGSARPPAMDVTGTHGAPPAHGYRPVPGYGPDGLPLQRTASGMLPPIPSVPPPSVRPPSLPPPGLPPPGVVSASVPPGPTRASQRRVLAAVVATTALVIGGGTTFLLRNSLTPSVTSTTVSVPTSAKLSVQPPSQPSAAGLPSGAAGARDAEQEASDSAGAATLAGTATPAPSEIAQQRGEEDGKGDDDEPATGSEKASSNGQADLERNATRGASAAPRARPSPRPRPKPVPRKRTVPDLDNPYQ